jgi:hypothetical protein
MKPLCAGAKPIGAEGDVSSERAGTQVWVLLCGAVAGVLSALCLLPGMGCTFHTTKGQYGLVEVLCV